MSDRYSSRNARRVTATKKAKQARAADEEVQVAEQAVADAQAQLKQAQAELKVRHLFTSFPPSRSHNMQSNSSGRVRPPRAQKSQPSKTSEIDPRAYSRAHRLHSYR